MLCGGGGWERWWAVLCLEGERKRVTGKKRGKMVVTIDKRWYCNGGGYGFSVGGGWCCPCMGEGCYGNESHIIWEWNE